MLPGAGLVNCTDDSPALSSQHLDDYDDEKEDHNYYHDDNNFDDDDDHSDMILLIMKNVLNYHQYYH